MLRRICESVGTPGHHFLMQCKLSGDFFTSQWPPGSFVPSMALMTPQEYEVKHKQPPEIGRMYFRHLTEHPPNTPITLQDVVLKYTMDRRLSGDAIALEQKRRLCFLNVLQVCFHCMHWCTCEADWEQQTG
jgi:hypothetical protein